MNRLIVLAVVVGVSLVGLAGITWHARFNTPAVKPLEYDAPEIYGTIVEVERDKEGEPVVAAWRDIKCKPLDYNPIGIWHLLKHDSPGEGEELHWQFKYGKGDVVNGNTWTAPYGGGRFFLRTWKRPQQLDWQFPHETTRGAFQSRRFAIADHRFGSMNLIEDNGDKFYAVRTEDGESEKKGEWAAIQKANDEKRREK